jgi:hypothetical protein
MSKKLKKGDRVSWNTAQGKTVGRVAKRLTKSTYIRGHKVKASLDTPQYLVESAKTGKSAAHRGEALKKLR